MNTKYCPISGLFSLSAFLVLLILFSAGAVHAQSSALGFTSSQSLSEKSRFFAKQRQDLLLREMRANPQSYLDHANLAGQRSKFGADIQQYIEEKITKKGKIVAVNSDNFSAGKSSDSYYFISDDANDSSSYKLYFAKNESINIPTGSRVELQGSELADNIVISDGANIKTIMPADAASASRLSANIAVILFQFEDGVSANITKDQMRSLFFTADNSVKALYNEMSYGTASITGDVFGWVTIPVKTTDELVTSENVLKLSDIVREEAFKAGLDVNKYDHYVYIHPKLTNAFVGWAGFGAVNGNFVWIDSPSTTDAIVYAHELGHNFGLSHASSIKCGQNQIGYYGNCTVWMYGDIYDIMGTNSAARGHFNVPHKIAIGIIPEDNVQLITQDGTYSIAPQEMSTAKIQALKIFKTDTREYYYIEYRQPIGFDNKSGTGYGNLWLGMTRGATIHIWNDNPSTPTKLIDTTPADNNNEALEDGKSFHDPVNDITITQIGHNSESVNLKITGTGSVMSKPIMKAVPAVASTNDTIAIAWTNVSPSAGDWIGVFKKNASDSEYVAKIFASNCETINNGRIGTATGDCDFWTGGKTVGEYDIRYFSNGIKTASNSFSIVNPSSGDPVLTVSPLTTKPGGMITISWKNVNPATAKDWIGVYSRGSADTAYLSRLYASSCTTIAAATPKTSGSCSYLLNSSAKPNTYELRLFSNDTYAKLDSTSFKLSNLNLLSLSAKPEKIALGDTITISWDGIPEITASDYITISPKNSADSNWLTKFYTAVCAPVQGRVCSHKIKITSMAAGDYEAKLFSGSQLKKMATAGFNLSYGTSISGTVSRSTGEVLSNVKIDLCDGGSGVITNFMGEWSKTVVSGAEFCVRIASGLPPETHAKASNNNSCHLADATYEHQIAGENRYSGCAYGDERSWDRDTNSGYNFTVAPKAVKCANQCISSGLRQCLGNSYQTCFDANNDGCLEWTPAVACGTGQFCQSGECNTISGNNNAQFIYQDVPPTMAAGESYEVTIIMKNSGNSSWTLGGGYRLASQNPQNNNVWGINKVELLANDTVLNGESKLFEFTVKAPSVPGTYNFQWGMSQNSEEWFGQTTQNLAIIVE